MALDGLVIRALTRELQALIGGKVTKIHQPNDHDIVLHIRSQGSNHKLLLSANPTYPRIHLSEQAFINPLEAPMFCMLLRKHCESGTITGIEQVGAERIVHIQVRHRDELGDLRAKTIVVELTGRHSNIILLNPDTGSILDGIHHVTPAISSYRVVMPGTSYTPPPEQNKVDPFTADQSDMRQSLLAAMNDVDSSASQQAAEHALVNVFYGISPLIAREIVFRCRITADTPAESEQAASAVASELFSLIESLQRGEAVPNIVTPPAGKSAFSITPLTHIKGENKAYTSVSDCLEAYYGGKAERDLIKQRASDLIRMLQNERNKNTAKLLKLQETIVTAQDADRYRIMGELLTASLHLVEKGATSVQVVNYYDENQSMIDITLDPQTTPSENAQRYFKKYNKLKNSIIVVQEQIAETQEEIRYMDELLQQIEHANVQDIEEIREELVGQGYLRRRGKPSKVRNKSGRPTLTCYVSSEGAPIYVGKNNTQNEYLTCRFAAPQDTWLHTKDIPGSHVVIRGSFNEQTLIEAANLSAWFSQARSSSQVPVDYTLIRHVKKPNGAKPGYVIYDKQKTLYVTPDEQRILSMKQQ